MLWITVIVLNCIMAIAIIAVTAILNSHERLKGQGYDDDYIELAQKEAKRLVPTLIPLFLAAQGIGLGIQYMITGVLDAETFLTTVLPFSFLGILPVMYLLQTRSTKKYQDLTKAKQDPIVVDFKHKMLHSLFNPVLDGILTFLSVLFCVLFLPLRSSVVIYLYIGIFWFYHLILRNYKNLPRQIYRDNYKTLGKFSIMLYSFFVLLIALEGTVSFLENGGMVIKILLFSITAAFALFRLIIFIFSLNKVKKNWEETQEL